jgi:excisionase family DNA binding protein
MESLLYTIKQAATLLNIGRSSVYNLMDQGKLHSVKVGGSRRITRHALTKYVEELETD